MEVGRDNVHESILETKVHTDVISFLSGGNKYFSQSLTPPQHYCFWNVSTALHHSLKWCPQSQTTIVNEHSWTFRRFLGMSSCLGNSYEWRYSYAFQILFQLTNFRDNCFHSLVLKYESVTHTLGQDSFGRWLKAEKPTPAVTSLQTDSALGKPSVSLLLIIIYKDLDTYVLKHESVNEQMKERMIAGNTKGIIAKSVFSWSSIISLMLEILILLVAT